MTDATELDALIAAVEAGSPWGDSERRLCLSALPKIKSGHGSRRLETHARNAYNGSLDAALALHEALLPGWHPLVGQNVHHHYWHANVQRIGEDGLIECEGCTDQAIPARAWLLAILKAYRAKVADNA